VAPSMCATSTNMSVPVGSAAHASTHAVSTSTPQTPRHQPVPLRSNKHEGIMFNHCNPPELQPQRLVEHGSPLTAVRTRPHARVRTQKKRNTVLTSSTSGGGGGGVDVPDVTLVASSVDHIRAAFDR
jgi:hypothetical protein